MSDLVFAAQIFLERHFAPLLLLCRRLVVGYPYRRIPLTQGKFACVDPRDYPALVRHKWCAAKQGNSWYAVRSEGNRQVRMHRVIMNAPPGLVVDHIDHDGLNNVPRNLRNCTQSQNACSRAARRSSSASAGTSASRNGGPASGKTAAPTRWACSTTKSKPPGPATPPP